ncbi:single-stranded-DNA-specific exonuclease RecJ [Phormidium sp. CLA17]|uniref:single-stranded-DNA-specific exonuclease RecJ n=1 Tax=Leptolyngbya sp. Cla-17 TaxID=2803751 RepID=UPI0014914849|nr:single-stranded-DNA-specific exonuclease RecJ [Leptolyngbya sp. Cla-17]MBM0740458.1 single-stranded-DNA-specific exonuclease RecJ [Leptolyngbya sp. Cla-17]
MPQAIQWHVQTSGSPDWFVAAVKQIVPTSQGYLAQLLWQRGIQNIDQLAGYLNPAEYVPTSPFAFGEEMHHAIARLKQARRNQEIVAIWGDFDADGVTATSVLWDGLGQFFTPQETLLYYIPNRLTESHGLSRQGLEYLHTKGCRLIVTCDTGSTNLEEIAIAREFGMDVVVTDHHTLPSDRPPVVAIINPRYLEATHPLASLSGVAVAYKLVEALYETLPEVPQKPLVELLDLVAIGLIADLVELKGDCRYLAQIGIEQLQKQSNSITMTRPGVAKLLEFCKRTGDRPTDISFGLGPRINAVSRIQGDAHFCVELLTSQDAHLCTQLAEATELANARRKALQKEVAQQVTARLTQLDLSTTRVIVLADEQWQLGVLGLVAGQIAQEYGRPTILLSTEPQTSNSALRTPLARGSARSVNNIDLYQLVKGQAHLLHRFGGHPFAAGLSLPVENVLLFAESINQELRQIETGAIAPTLQIDLTVTVAELGKELFQELKLLEPCGMGNPSPKLLIQNCWFEKAWNKNIKDRRGGKVQYIKTEFELRDDSTEQPFPGVWWGHYRDEIPQGRCDLVVELDSNTYERRYEVRIVAVRPQESMQTQDSMLADDLLDWRGLDKTTIAANMQQQQVAGRMPLVLRQVPTSWTEFQVWVRRAQQEQRSLVIAYTLPTPQPPMIIWQTLVGIAKYLSRTGQTATRQQLLDKLELSDHALQLGFKTLALLNFEVQHQDQAFAITGEAIRETIPTGSAPSIESTSVLSEAVQDFLNAVREDQFRRQYFCQVPITVIRALASFQG